MQTVTIVNQAANAAITGTSTAYRPVVGYTSVFVAEVKATAAATPTTTGTVALQGSLDGVDWVTIDSFAVSAMTQPVGVTPDWTSTGGYRTYVKVVQGFPLMRVCTSAGIGSNGSHTLTAYVANG
jgi:hypothetical protein